MLMRPHNQSGSHAYALVLVMVFMGIGTLLLAGVMDWISTRSRLVQRNHTFQSALAASEAAADKALNAMTVDFMEAGEAEVYGRLDKYRRMVPEKSESRAWDKVDFFDALGNNDRLTIERISAWAYGPLGTKYTGLKGFHASYRLTGGARLESLPGVYVSTLVQHDLQLASIPVFGLQVYSAMDLEICPAANFNFQGRVHCNGNLYLDPDTYTLYFRDHVTAAAEIVQDKHPEDPVSRPGGRITYYKERDRGAKHLKLPLGTIHTPGTLRCLVEMPPRSEKADSALGQQRFYNKTDLIVTVEDKATRATSGEYNGFRQTIPALIVNAFLSTNQSFYDKRESRTVQVVDLDIKSLIAQMGLLKLYLGRDLRSVYIANLRTNTPGTINGVRVVNGETIPTTGLTIATASPLYVRGHFNSDLTYRGTTNTSRAHPAALVADAITVLSSNWDDEHSQEPLASRPAANTTINAAIITGMVPTGGGFYSGGYENSLRLLENWTGQRLNFNGSMAFFYYSVVANSPWGALDDVYTPPTRIFAFDGNFLNENKLPPGTPELRTVLRAKYTVLPPPAGL